MSLQAEIGLLKKQLDKINDEHLIKAIKELIKYSNSKREQDILKPFTREEIINRAKQSEKNIRQGRFKTASTVRKDIKNW